MKARENKYLLWARDHEEARHRLVHRLATLLLAFCLLSATITPAWACGPDFSEAIMVNGIHPDMPLKLFAEGHLGIIQAGYAKSYLIVAYRYLQGIPLDAQEQDSIVKLWHERLRGAQVLNPEESPTTVAIDPGVQYFQLRARTLGEKVKEPLSRYDFRFAENIKDDAFLNAVKNLRAVISEFGEHSLQVQDWLKAQDKVFGAESGTASDPEPAAADAAPTMKLQRAYQLASAKFYANDMARAQELFEAMANDKSCPWQDLASYMAARSTVTAALNGQDDEALAAAEKYTSGIIAANPHSAYKRDLLDLVETLQYRERSSSESLDCLVKAVLQPHSERFGNNVGDLTYLLIHNLDDSGRPVAQADQQADPESDFPVEKYDLTDWLTTIHQADQTWTYSSIQQEKDLVLLDKKRAQHALDKWRQTHALTWLVAALLCNDLSQKDNSDLARAAAAIKADSKAYLTAEFFVVDSLLKAQRNAEADKILQVILARKDLPPSARNLFMCQRMVASRSIDEYMHNIVQRPVSISSYFDTTQSPDNWLAAEKLSSYYSCDAVIANTLCADLNANLPQSYWVSWTKDKSLPRSLSAQIILAAWLRSKLLGLESGLGKELDDALVQACPSLKKLMAAYKAAHDGPEKQFALAWLIIKTWGMTPYLQAGISRHGTDLGDWDAFNENFWLPLPPIRPDKSSAAKHESPYDIWGSQIFYGSARMRANLKFYSQPVLMKLLSAADRKQLETERLAIWNNHPSRFLGERILAWAKSHPQDPRLPEALYHLVKLPRWSSERTDVGSKYSRAAFLVLHKQYPNSAWAQKAEYWY